MGYLLVVYLKRIFRNFSLWAAYLIKSLILIAAAFIMHLLLYTVNTVSIFGVSIDTAFHRFYGQMFHVNWLMQKTFYWLILFFITQLIIEINEKYSPGVFMDIFLGKYIEPKTEKRIIMFIDLKDSTSIAEKMPNKRYFRFIREFIYHISNALIENGGRIYQYVGDEIVVSWRYSKRNMRRCIKALIDARKNLRRNSTHFKRRYGVIPEYRIGVHVGDVTIGEIGVIKKDLAMSGDAMNTAARIKAASTELNHDFLLSKDFVDHSNLKDGQKVNLGLVELKGKVNEVELYSLKI
jgi:adenylate cyclase